MAPEDTQQTPEEIRAKRLARISPAQKTAKVNQNYSRFIRHIQIMLPIIALIMITIILNWNRFKTETISPLQEEAQAVVEQSIGKNEFLEPRFESVDSKGQPYTITANNAVQGNDEDLIILEEPGGKLNMTNGAYVTLQAISGAYRQKAQKLFLQGDVVMTHNEKDQAKGYQMDMDELHVDLDTNTAWADVNVLGTGPDVTLNAKGLKASSPEETLIFTGPAKLVLTLEDGGLDLGDLAQ